MGGGAYRPKYEPNIYWGVWVCGEGSIILVLSAPAFIIRLNGLASIFRQLLIDVNIAKVAVYPVSETGHQLESPAFCATRALFLSTPANRIIAVPITAAAINKPRISFFSTIFIGNPLIKNYSARYRP
ncbi:MAG: hypothetical protein FWC60_09865 [Firmicutes bacterium]|nr:hypothetical protein [Bacillota bacterium]